MLRTTAWGTLRSHRATWWDGYRAYIRQALVRVMKRLGWSLILRRIIVGAIAARSVDLAQKNWANLNARCRIFGVVAWSIPDRIYRRANMTRPQYLAVLSGSVYRDALPCNITASTRQSVLPLCCGRPQTRRVFFRGREPADAFVAAACHA